MLKHIGSNLKQNGHAEVILPGGILDQGNGKECSPNKIFIQHYAGACISQVLSKSTLACSRQSCHSNQHTQFPSTVDCLLLFALWRPLKCPRMMGSDMHSFTQCT